VKFLDKKTIGDFITPENQLVDWGGTDDYKYKWAPEVRGEKQPKKPKDFNGVFDKSVESASPLHSPSPSPSPTMMTPIPNGKSPPEVRPRKSNKVKFQGADGGADQTRINLTSIDDSADRPSKMTVAPAAPFPPLPVTGGPLAEVDETMTFTNPGSGVMASFHVQNLKTQTIIMKVKTTAPDKYRVRPTIGLIEGEARAVLNVYVYEGVPIWTLPHDKFQVQVSLIPPGVHIGNLDNEPGRGSHTNFGDLSSKWKSIIKDRDREIETHKLSCKLDPKLKADGSISRSDETLFVSEDDMRTGLSLLERKMAASFSAIMDQKLRYIEYLLYGLIALVILVGIILYFSMPSSKIKIPENICTMAEHNQVFAGVMGGGQRGSRDAASSTCAEH
jgi:hypothetical protein